MTRYLKYVVVWLYKNNRHTDMYVYISIYKYVFVCMYLCSAIWPASYSVSVQSKGGRPLAQRLRASSGGIHRTQFIGLGPLGLAHCIQTFGFNPLDSILGAQAIGRNPFGLNVLDSIHCLHPLDSIQWAHPIGLNPSDSIYLFADHCI